MDDKLCEANHKRVDERLNVHDIRLNNHGDRIDKLEIFSSKLEERLDSLIKQLGELNTTMKWFMRLLIGAFVGFFFYFVQQKL